MQKMYYLCTIEIKQQIMKDYIVSYNGKTKKVRISENSDGLLSVVNVLSALDELTGEHIELYKK